MHFQGNGQVYMNMYRNTLIYREKSIERERGGPIHVLSVAIRLF